MAAERKQTAEIKQAAERSPATQMKTTEMKPVAEVQRDEGCSEV